MVNIDISLRIINWFILMMVQHQSNGQSRIDTITSTIQAVCCHKPKKIKYRCGWWCTAVKQCNCSSSILIMKNCKGRIILLWRPMGRPSSFKILCDCVLGMMNFLIMISYGLVLVITSSLILPISERRPVYIEINHSKQSLEQQEGVAVLLEQYQ